MPILPGLIPITTLTDITMATTILGVGASPCHGDGVILIMVMADVIPGMVMARITAVMVGEVDITTVITMAGMTAIGMEVGDITQVAEALTMALPANPDTLTHLL